MDRTARAIVVIIGVLVALTATAAAQARTFSVRGSVRMASSGAGASTAAGVAGVRITFIRRGGTGALPAPVVTDASGTFRQSGFVVGTIYAARPSKVGLTFDPPSQPVSPTTSLAFVAAGLQPAPLVLPFTVTGRVGTRTRGTGMAKVKVVFTRAGAGRVPDPVETDAHGDWTQRGFEPGVVYQATPTRGLFVFDPPTLELKGGSGETVRTAEVSVPDTFSLTGRIRRDDGRAIGPAMIQAKMPLQEGELHCARTAADGTFRLDGLQSGQDYVVEPIYREGALFTFSPPYVRLDGPEPLSFSGHPDRLVVSQTRFGNNCPLP